MIQRALSCLVVVLSIRPHLLHRAVPTPEVAEVSPNSQPVACFHGAWKPASTANGHGAAPSRVTMRYTYCSRPQVRLQLHQQRHASFCMTPINKSAQHGTSSDERAGNHACMLV